MAARVLPTGLVEGLVEVVLRVRDLDAVPGFHERVLGLPLLRRFGDDMVFLALPGPRGGGRTQAVALFAEQWPSNIPGAAWSGHAPSGGSLHHFALGVSLAGLVEAERRLREAGVPAHPREFPWAGWRSLMLSDPEGNTVELVAEDPSVLADAGS